MDSKDKSLAIAYAVKRHAKKKKMANGGMIENESLNPMHRADMGVENKLLKQFGLSKHEQSHGQLAQPHEVKSDFDPHSDTAEKFRKYTTKGMYPQTHASEASGDEAYLAKGGMLYPNTSKKIRTESPIEGHDLGDQPEDFIDHDEKEPFADGGEVKLDDKKVADAQESMRRAFNYNDGGIAKGVMHKRKMAQGGYLEPDYDYLAENDSYPDVDEKEHDVLDYDVDAPSNKVAKRKQMLKKIFSED